MSWIAMTWAWYLLCKHPEVAQKLYAEVKERVGDRKVEVEDLEKML